MFCPERKFTSHLKNSKTALIDPTWMMNGNNTAAKLKMRLVAIKTAKIVWVFGDETENETTKHKFLVMIAPRVALSSANSPNLENSKHRVSIQHGWCKIPPIKQ